MPPLNVPLPGGVPIPTTDPGFAAAVDAEILRRSRALLGAVLAYRSHPFHRPEPALETVHVEGTSRVLAPACADGPPVLVIPSLINRWYVLDLLPGRSLVEYLAGAGLSPHVVDWGAPGPLERDFDLTGYVAGRLEGALDAVLERTGSKPALLGYCMGGLLALALAQRRQDDLSSLVLMATPWDFSGSGAGRLIMAWRSQIGTMLEMHGELPTEVIQAMFHAIDPLLTVRKFLKFAEMDRASPECEDFVALEDWINDGVPLAAPVARETLFGWYGENRPARGAWMVAGEPVEPRRMSLPSLLLVPVNDRIVPPDSAIGLAAELPDAVAIHIALGHIGMVTSRHARARAWQRLTDWLQGNMGE